MTIKVGTSGRWKSSRKDYDDKTQHFDNNGKLLFILQQEVGRDLCDFNKMSWCEGVYYKVSVEWELMK